jgi:hypothetical protein
MTLFGNFESEIDEVNIERGSCLLCDEEDNETSRSLKFTKTQRRRKLLNNKWPNMSEEVAFRKLLTGNRIEKLSDPCIKLEM